MAYGTTKELRAIAIGGKTFIQGEHTPLSYDEAMEFSKDDRLKITISPQEHAANFGRAASEEPQTPTVPEVKMTEAQQIEAIKVAIDNLDMDDTSNWTQSGMPDARALTKALGWQVTSALRDKAMKVSTPAAPAERPKGGVTIVRKAAADGTAEPLDTGAGLEGADDDPADATQDGAVEV